MEDSRKSQIFFGAAYKLGSILDYLESRREPIPASMEKAYDTYWNIGKDKPWTKKSS